MSAILELKRSLIPPPVDPVEVYLSGLAVSGKRSMRSHLMKIAGILGYSITEEVQWHKLTYAQTMAVREALIAEGLAPTSIRTILAALKGVLWACYKQGMMSREQYDRILVKAPRGERLKRGRDVPAEERQAMLAACNNGQPHRRARDRALFLILSETGMRRDELCGLTLESIQDGCFVLTGKGNKEREIPIKDTVLAAIEEWLEVRGREPGYLICEVDRWDNIVPCRLTGSAIAGVISRLASEAGIAPVSPHDLRRTMVGRMKAAGVDDRTGAMLLGHSKLDTYNQYDRRPLKDMREAIERI